MGRRIDSQLVHSIGGWIVRQVEMSGLGNFAITEGRDAWGCPAVIVLWMHRGRSVQFDLTINPRRTSVHVHGDGPTEFRQLSLESAIGRLRGYLIAMREGPHDVAEEC